MTKEAQDFTTYAGEYKEVTIGPVKGDDGQPVDLTGATIVWVAKRASTDTEAQVSKTTGDGITILDQGTDKGKFKITLDAADSDKLGGETYLHEARITDAAGHPESVTRGRWLVKHTLT